MDKQVSELRLGVIYMYMNLDFGVRLGYNPQTGW